MIDYLIVGLGLAGISFCETLERNNKTFVVLNDTSQASSMVAGGLYNPVILKRFTPVWMAEEQQAGLLPFYASLEKKLGVTLIHSLPVFRRFASVEEQNLWFEAADKVRLRNFLSSRIHLNSNPLIDAPFGYGEVLGTGRVDTKKLLLAYWEHLSKNEVLINETFNYAALNHGESHVAYNAIKARHIVFAEGFGLKHNPYFNYLPLTGTKGEYLTIRAPDLNEKNAVKASIFLIPIGDDLYKVGATYKWKDTTNTPTVASKIELLDKLETFLKCDFEVVDQTAGIRPTVTDRRPLVGRHPKCKNMYVLNGFGSRGVSIAPWASQQLFGHIEKQEAMHPEMDISRFTKKYFSH
tara:strand:- start:2142 stop:3197 length:1056 start_codon:yes stop_codon:yes gene_type:complete